jgi:hypothetical protein
MVPHDSPARLVLISGGYFPAEVRDVILRMKGLLPSIPASDLSNDSHPPQSCREIVEKTIHRLEKAVDMAEAARDILARH